MDKARKKLNSRILCLFLLTLVLFPIAATAATSYTIGKATVTASFVSHRGTTDCKDLAVGSGTHYCCWNYAYDAYKKIWGKNFSKSDNNLLSEVEAADRTMTAANLAKYFAEAQPGANFRMDTNSKPTGGDNNGHSMIFLENGSDGAWFWEGNYNGKGSVRIHYWTWTKLVNSYGRDKDGNIRYIKYIIWPGAHSFNGFTVIDSTLRIAVSTKDTSSSDPCRLQKLPYDTDENHVRNANKGDVLYIKGSVKNRYDNIWYITEDDLYVYSGDISITEDDASFSSVTDADFVGVVTTNDGYLKRKPFEAADHLAGTISKGKTVEIVGEVTNSHGNKWYKTADGYYIYSGDVSLYQSKDLFTIDAIFKNTEKRYSHAVPYLDSAEVKSIASNANVTVTKFVENSHGNIWAQLSDGSYLCFYDFDTKENKLTFVSANSSPSISNSKYPTGNLTQGKAYDLTGVISTKVPFYTVTAHIINRETGAEAGSVGTPVTVYPSPTAQKVDINAKVNGTNINTSVIFDKLAAGWYSYQIKAQYGFTYNNKTFKFGSEQTLLSSDFSVGKSGQLPEENDTPTEYSTLFTLSAKFKNTEARNSHVLPYQESDVASSVANGEIVTVTEFVTNDYGNIWAKLSDGSFLCFYDVTSKKNNLIFDSHVVQPTESTTRPSGNITVSATQGFWLKGPVEAKVPFLTVSTRVINRETEKDVASTGSPVSVSPAYTVRKLDIYETKFNGVSLDSQTVFNNLANGWYRYELNAQFGFKYNDVTFKFGNEMNLVSSNFTVGKAGQEDPPQGDEEILPDIPDDPRLAGDANNDGLINVADAMIIRQHIAGYSVPIHLVNANVNGDDTVNVADAMMIRQFLAGYDVILR